MHFPTIDNQIYLMSALIQTVNNSAIKSVISVPTLSNVIFKLQREEPIVHRDLYLNGYVTD